MSRRLLACLWAAALAGPLAARAGGVPGAEDDLPGEGQPAPTFRLRALNPAAAGGDFVGLDQLAGDEPEDAGSKVVLLSFFASWCGPCQQELPFLETLHRAYREQGLRVLSVDIDEEEAGIALARRQIADARVGFPVLSDRFALAARRYLGREASLPAVFLIRRDGTIARVERGYGKDAAALLRGAVQQALGLERSGAERK